MFFFVIGDINICYKLRSRSFFGSVDVSFKGELFPQGIITCRQPVEVIIAVHLIQFMIKPRRYSVSHPPTAS